MTTRKNIQLSINSFFVKEDKPNSVNNNAFTNNIKVDPANFNMLHKKRKYEYNMFPTIKEKFLINKVKLILSNQNSIYKQILSTATNTKKIVEEEYEEENSANGSHSGKKLSTHNKKKERNIHSEKSTKGMRGKHKSKELKRQKEKSMYKKDLTAYFTKEK